MSNELIKEMNVQVSTWSVLYTKLHNYHWYVKGHQFFTLHNKVEELYNEATSHMDEIAERILTLDGDYVDTLKEHLEQYVVEEGRGDEKADEMVKDIDKDYEKREY